MRSANRALYGSGPGALSVGAQRSLCRGPALSVSGPGAAPRHSLSGSLSGPSSRSLCWRPSGLCVRARRFHIWGPVGVCVGGRQSSLNALWIGPRRSLSVSGPGTLCCVPPIRRCGRPAPIQLRSAYHPSGRRVQSNPPTPRQSGRGPQLRSACHPSSAACSLFPGESPKPYCLGEYTLFGLQAHIHIYVYIRT